MLCGKIKNKIYLVTLPALLMSVLIGCNSIPDSDLTNTGKSDFDDMFQISEETSIENNTMILSYNPETSAISLEVKKTGKKWNSIPDEEKLSMITNETIKAQVASELVLRYI